MLFTLENRQNAKQETNRLFVYRFCRLEPEEYGRAVFVAYSTRPKNCYSIEDEHIGGNRKNALKAWMNLLIAANKQGFARENQKYLKRHCTMHTVNLRPLNATECSIKIDKYTIFLDFFPLANVLSTHRA